MRKRMGLIGIALLTALATLYACNQSQPAQSVTVQSSSMNSSSITQTQTANATQTGPTVPVSANVPIH